MEPINCSLSGVLWVKPCNGLSLPKANNYRGGCGRELMGMGQLNASDCGQVGSTAISPGVPTVVAPGIFVLRLPLPTRLNHVNAYLLEDDDGWAIIDTGMWHEGCRAAWTNTFAGILSGKPVTKLLITHFHLDHVGLAGWIHERFAPPFLVSQAEYLLSRVFECENLEQGINHQTAFFRQCGLDPGKADDVSRQRMALRALRTPLPDAFRRIRSDETIRIGGRDWQFLTGAGHAVEQVMLYAPGDRLFLSADQVLPEISPNISVGPMLPDGDPLGDFLDSLREIRAKIAEDVLVLPGHRNPFLGLHKRIDELQQHHDMRCAAVLKACRGTALTGLDLVLPIFGRTFGADVIGHALGEAVAHANYLKARRLLSSAIRQDGTLTYTTL